MSTSLSKTEKRMLAAIAVIVAVAAIYHLVWPAIEKFIGYQAGVRQIEHRQEEIAALSATVSIGSTAQLVNPSNAAYLPWDGIVEATVEKAVLYDSYEVAALEYELGPLFYDMDDAASMTGGTIQDFCFLVATIRFANIDAKAFSRDDSVEPFDFNIFRLTFEHPRLSNPMPMFICSFSGTPKGTGEEHRLKANLNQGESQAFTFGYWVPVGSTNLEISPTLNEHRPTTFNLGIEVV